MLTIRIDNGAAIHIRLPGDREPTLDDHCMIERGNIPNDTLENPGDYTALLEAVRGWAMQAEFRMPFATIFRNSWYPAHEEPENA